MKNVRLHSAQSVTVGMISAVAFVAALTSVSVEARADVLVSPGNMNGWSFNSRDSTGAVNPSAGSVGAIVTGPATPPIGTGSANIAVGNGTAGGDGAEELSTSNYNGIALSSITSLSYWTYDTKNNGSQFPYLTLAISYPGTSSPDILFFEPPYQTPTTGNSSLPNQGATQMNTWQQWNALAGGWWSDNSGNQGTGVEPLSYYVSQDAGATITVDPFASTLGGLGLNVGFGNPTDQFNGYVDALTIGINGTNTTYNFDTATVPEPATLGIFAAALTVLGLLRRTRSAG